MQQYITALLPYAPKQRLLIRKEKNDRLNKKKKKKKSIWLISLPSCHTGERQADWPPVAFFSDYSQSARIGKGDLPSLPSWNVPS